MTNWDLIVSGKELDEAASVRKQDKEKVSRIKLSDLPIYETQGWTREKESKDGKTFTLVKDKASDEIFENEVWLILYNMGFTKMNRNNNFTVDLGGNSKQIDIIAMDDETCLFVECKSTETLDKSRTFKTEIESIYGYYPDLVNEVKKKYGNKYKFKYIFATKKYVISEKDIERLNTYNIAYFNDDSISYYDSLVNHLGKASRYQLLGNLFENSEIKNLENRVMALEGKMGGIKYYMFSIEPERLLKMAFILHRTRANHLMMPTYQRLIKKERLKSVRDFINNGNYFPNSIIVSVDTKEKGLRFDQFSTKDLDSSVKCGVLYLPKRYKSMYVIDGQHRLYGYSDTLYANNNVIPVVAFLDMEKEEQVKMFMDINENQKSVSKSLRNTLNIDLQWNSPDLKKRKEALMLQVAENLGDDSNSPLYKKVLTGEDKPNESCYLSTDIIKDAIKDSDFLNEYSKNNIKSLGTLDKNDNEKTLPVLTSFLIKCLNTVIELCDDEWKAGSSGFLAINNSIYALIKILNDIVNIKLKESGESKVNNPDAFFEKCENMLFSLSDAILQLSDEEKNKIKKAKGNSAKKESWRVLQVALNRIDHTFITDDLQKYLDEYCLDNIDESKRMINKLDKHLNSKFKNAISDSIWKDIVPDSLDIEIVSNVAQENRKRERNNIEEKVDNWFFVSFDEIKKITNYGSNWTNYCQNLLRRKSDPNMTKSSTSIWITNLSNFKSKIKSGKSLSKQEYDELKKIYKDFFEVDDATDN